MISFSQWRRFALVLAVVAAGVVSTSQSQAQKWATESPLKVARWAHTATLLDNGSVLIAGGTLTNQHGFFAETNGCELFDPASGTTQLTADMQRKRHSHQATRLDNGRVLVTGGGGDHSSETFDPPSGTWIHHVPMGRERLVHTATLLLDGTVLVAGGYDDSDGSEVAEAELYDPVAATWSDTAPMPYAADTLAAARLDNGMVLVCGGYDGNVALTNAVLYDPSTRTWTNTAPMNQARSGHTATLMENGTVLVVGGAGDNSAEVYDPVAGSWSTVATLNDGWSYPTAVLLGDGRVMIAGDGNTDVELYDPDSDTWNYADPLPLPGHLQTATLLKSGAVLVTGGSESQYNGPALAAVQLYGSLVRVPTLDITSSPRSGAPPLIVQFTSPLVDGDGNTVTNWSWDFGDGGTSQERSPSHTYASVGYYSPSLVANSTFGSDPLHVTGLGPISVAIPILIASANPQTGQTPLTVQFSTPSRDSDGFTVTNWNWTFGDGSTSTEQNPSHTYVHPGTFSPALVAFSTYGPSPVTTANSFAQIVVTNPPNPSFHILHAFTAASGFPATNADGAGPNGDLVLSGNTLYGTAQHGGGSGYGTLFSVTTSGADFTRLYSFGSEGTSGAIPPAGVVLAGSTLFGTTYLGGTRGGGAIFAINADGTDYRNLLNYNFNVDPTSGQQPQAGVVLADQTLYGATWFGGAANHGTLSYVSTNGLTSGILHHFSLPSGPDFNINYDGLFPSARLLFSNGTLYGTAESGGSFSSGTVFAVETNAPGSFRVLHYFTATTPRYTGTNTDGALPFAGLVLSGDTLYGTTFGGGNFGYGTVFAVHTDGTGFTNLHSFAGGNEGYGPHSGLTLSGDTLYGTTSGGGSLGTLSSGTLFALNTDGSGFRTLYEFSGGSDGANPQGELVLSGNTLYGTAATGGDAGSGTLFSFNLPASGLPVALLAPQASGATFQFSFLSQSGFTHDVEYRTNLVAGLNWQVYSNVTGDGTLKTIPIPRSVFSPSQQGFVRVLTR